MTARRVVGWLLLTAVVVWFAGTAFRLYARKYYMFLPDYVRWMAASTPAVEGPTQVFFLFTDHFEPDYSAERVRRWASRYKQLASRHRDADGRPPQHSFFYPGEQSTPEIFAALGDLVGSGLGEVELHYHHDFDTTDTFREKLRQAIEDFSHYGFLKTIDGETHFAFIHGNWGLDNSNGPIMCGVNEELALLREMGCFADFTFPSVYEDSQPAFVNAIYAAKDDATPKSYRRRLPLSALDDGSADLMIFEGPILFAPSLNPTHLFLDLDDGDIHPAVPASAARVDRWVRADVHVANRPDWIFIKVHGHGISSPEDEEAALGRGFDEALTRLETRYNDGRRYRLHYITAREAYNLAHAAASGAKGDPEQYLDQPIPPYVADRPRRISETPED